jgi:hypothetical protein
VIPEYDSIEEAIRVAGLNRHPILCVVAGVRMWVHADGKTEAAPLNK